MAENAARAAWAGVSLTVPRPLRHGSTLRWAVTRVIDDPAYRRRAQAIADSRWAKGGAARAAEAVERLVNPI